MAKESGQAKVGQPAAFVPPEGTEERVNDLLFSLTNMFNKIAEVIESKKPPQGKSVFDTPKTDADIELERTNEERLNAHRAAKEAKAHGGK